MNADASIVPSGSDSGATFISNTNDANFEKLYSKGADTQRGSILEKIDATEKEDDEEEEDDDDDEEDEDDDDEIERKWLQFQCKSCSLDAKRVNVWKNSEIPEKEDIEWPPPLTNNANRKGRGSDFSSHSFFPSLYHFVSLNSSSILSVESSTSFVCVSVHFHFPFIMMISNELS